VINAVWPSELVLYLALDLDCIAVHTYSISSLKDARPEATFSALTVEKGNQYLQLLVRKSVVLF
jgi:hypothetical protein